ncbi:HD domain-containing protein [Rhodococcus sp. BS-15]|uniref:HD domain-containing protein n=1 Tax=Rhodococcus sp. BS-15 TaxID=1304954 RepID=UPI000B069E73|nr:HD domain-containing protein [Rhodococcus sp. BS-15]
MRPGELGAGDRVRTVGYALGQQLSMLPGTLLGPRRRSSNTVWAIVDVPDSRLCRDALEEARECLSEPMLLHSQRCWQYASAFAAVDDVCPDPEALYVSCLLHDIALGGEPDIAVGCFALIGADRAEKFVRRYEGDDRTAQIVHEAIARHMDTARPEGPEAALLNDAAYLDVSGRRIRELDPHCIDVIESRYTRESFAADFACRMKIESRMRPRSTAATLWRAGMYPAIKVNPLERMVTSSK